MVTLVAIAAACVAATLAIYLVFALPANLSTDNWTVTPQDWARLRLQWEAAHAANAVITFAELCCLAWAALRQQD